MNTREDDMGAGARTSALAPLARLDPALPGIAVLAGLPGLRPTYLRYKPGTSLVAMVETSSGPAMACVTSPQAAPKSDKLAAHAPAGSVLLHDPRARLLLALPVADRDLPGLRRRVGPGARTFAYKPQRRWVGLPSGAADEDPVWRCYRRGDVERTRPRWPDVPGPGGTARQPGAAQGPGAARGGDGAMFRIPAVVRTSSRHDILRTARVDGTGLDTLLTQRPDDLEVVRRTGRALALWHRLPLPAHTAVPGSDPGAAAMLLSHLLPDHRPRIQELAARLRATETARQARADRRAQADPGPDLVWSHGDFSTDQVLVDPEGALWLMDWDRSGAAPRGTDLASAEAAGLSPAARTALLEGYGSAADLPADLDLARARALFSRAADPFRRADPDWPARLATRLDTVQELLS
jgi:aminoglycoside phosphotransferase